MFTPGKDPYMWSDLITGERMNDALRKHQRMY